MFQWLLKKLKARKLANYSTTLTDSSVGTKSLHELNPNIKNSIKKIKNNESLEVDEFNELLQFYFKTRGIESNLYRFNKAILDSCVFELKYSKIFLDSDTDDVRKITLELKEVTHNIDMVITIDAKELYEAFEPFNFSPNMVH